MRFISRVGAWLDHRLKLGEPILETVRHRVPRETASWFYVFGSAALTVFLLQVVTGILLALIYVPSAAEAWNSLQVLNHQITLGWFIRALHGWGSNFMIAIVLIHMVQVFLFGAYKYPRELTWMVGVFLLLVTLGMGFTGQVMRFDQDAYWGLGIGASIVSRVPLIGPWLVTLLLGGPIIAGATLSRFFTLHVFVIPGLLIGFVSLHLLLVLKLGINEWPMPGRIVRRETYLREYQELTHRDGFPFVPYAVWKDIIFSGSILLAIAVCAAFLGPFGPGGQPDPTIIQTAPRPDFFFLWLYAVLSFLPPDAETPLLLIAPIIGIAFLLALPFFAGEGEKSWKRRPIAVLTVLLLAVALGSLTRLGQHTPWSPLMNAWSSTVTPHPYLKGRAPLELRGALVLQAKQCRNCHSLDDRGGRRGPALDTVAIRLTHDQLIRQVIQGGGNMPAYGKNLSPAETTALVAFLTTLHPAGQAPARDASQKIVLGDHPDKWRQQASIEHVDGTDPGK
jgi:ubiquinol-cytochrome c reductase cytochrome b subunit